MSDKSPQVGQIDSLIPQVFYDIIGRIVPGCVLLCVAFLLLGPSDWQVASQGIRFGALEISYGWLLWPGLIFSYTLGIVLGASGYFVMWQEWGQRPSRVKVQAPDCSTPTAGVYDSYIYDIIQVLEPAAGARLVKLAAEQNMCRVLIAGSAILALFCAYSLWDETRRFSSAVIILGLVVTSAMCCLFHHHVSVRSQILMLNLWHRFAEDGRVKVRTVERLHTRTEGENTELKTGLSASGISTSKDQAAQIGGVETRA